MLIAIFLSILLCGLYNYYIYYKSYYNHSRTTQRPHGPIFVERPNPGPKRGY